MKYRILSLGLLCFFLLACTVLEADNPSSSVDPTRTPAPTPSTMALHENMTLNTGARVRVTVRSVELLKREPDTSAQLLVVLADGQGHSSYLLYPANRSGDPTNQFNLADYPLELSLDAQSTSVSLWILALHNSRYLAAEKLGILALVLNLSRGFDSWLATGDLTDDPLAGVVSQSEGVLYEWFAGVEVLGQGVTSFAKADNWSFGTNVLRSADDGLSAVYSMQYISEEEVALITPTPPSPSEDHPGYELILDEDFLGGRSVYDWFQGQDTTYANSVVADAYEISLTDIRSREFGVSWGSMEGQRFSRYLFEADISLLENSVIGARYGIWYNYQDGKNFMYFGISNDGRYLVAIFKDNQKIREIQGWTMHPAIHTGAAKNTLSVEADGKGNFTLGINGSEVIAFTDETYPSGEIAFFCYAQSVPATCRLERLRIWEPTTE
ncbi:MAG TPA: hypothetical protein VHP83_25545 [Aggregatilineaceae bacterium]|nr:hypothetical protein [Aggregatilineaceae bacterium]